jgi:16S rRNA (uracil1498-N3)-methyltransferase
MKLFIREQPSAEQTFSLGRDVKKRLIKVMRLATGDPVEVFSGGKRYNCRISRILPDGIELRIIDEILTHPRSKFRLILGQSIPKGEKFDWLIQKGTELGISEIYPLLSERTIARPSPTPSRLARWNQIAEHAAAQSENPYPPLIHPPESIETFLQRDFQGLKIFLHERQDTSPLRDLLLKQTHNLAVLLVGPEGGWTPTETMNMEQAGYTKIHMGKRILKSDTAGLALAAILQYELGDLSG